MQLKARLAHIIDAAVAGGNQALGKGGRSPIVADARGGGLTTAEDEKTQATVVRMLRESDPDTNVIGEEALDKRMTERAYIIDPIDGSVNYARDGLEWCCTVAYKNGDRIDAGVIWQPRTRTLLRAVRGGEFAVETIDWTGSVTPERVPPSPTSPVDLRKAVVIAPTSGEFSDEVITEVFNPILRNVRFLMMSGSNTDGIKRLILGHVDVFIGWGSLWDFAAGKLFVEMMGGAAATFHGDAFDANVIAPQRVVFARSQALLDTILPFTSKWPIEREKRR